MPGDSVQVVNMTRSAFLRLLWRWYGEGRRSQPFAEKDGFASPNALIRVSCWRAVVDIIKPKTTHWWLRVFCFSYESTGNGERKNNKASANSSRISPLLKPKAAYTSSSWSIHRWLTMRKTPFPDQETGDYWSRWMAFHCAKAWATLPWIY